MLTKIKKGINLLLYYFCTVLDGALIVAMSTLWQSLRKQGDGMATSTAVAFDHQSHTEAHLKSFILP